MESKSQKSLVKKGIFIILLVIVGFSLFAFILVKENSSHKKSGRDYIDSNQAVVKPKFAIEKH